MSKQIFKSGTLAAAAAVCLAGLISMPAWGAISGAIQTTFPNGTTVNGNIYPSKDQVYLTGGPQNMSSAGISPNGLYYFQVTDPSGTTLLSTDPVQCRVVIVSGNVMVGVPTPGNDPNYAADLSACTTSGGTGFHAIGTMNAANGSTPVQLIPYNDTSNPGGEYKAWISTDSMFPNSTTKTDNFKVRNMTSSAYVTVCKFNDLNNNGTQDSGEPVIPGWPISAVGVDLETSSGIGTVTAQTDATGCVSFSVSSFTNNTATVTLTEGTLGAGWTQTAPGNGSYDATGASAATGPTMVSGASGVPPLGGVISVTLSPGNNVTAPSFGNYNPACSTATACGGTSLMVTKNANPSQKYTWTIVKSVDKTQVDTSGSATFNYSVTVTHNAGTGWVVAGNITVSNPTPADIVATITDVVSSKNATCLITDANGGLNELISAGAQNVQFPYTCTYPGPAMPAADTNNGTATYGLSNVSGTALINFSGAVIDGTVTVTDTLGGSLGTVYVNSDGTTGYTAANNGITVTAVTNGVTFSYPLTFTDPAGTCTTHLNTASFTTNTTNTMGPSGQSVQVCVGADLMVSKTVAPTFTRTYNWNIAKGVSPSGTVETSGSSTLNYTVTANETGFTDSGWALTGTITVTNPNSWEAITASVADTLPGCSLTSNGTGLTINAGASVMLGYSCAFASAVSGPNTATASWTGSYTPHTMASGTAGFSFTTPTTTVNKTVTVTDTYAGTLGTLTATDTTPYTTHTYTYSRSVTVTGGMCSAFTNTATVGTTTLPQPSASVTVTVCNEATGALSKGFWQNNNGQGIIKGQAATGVCPSTAWLRQFNAFQDLSATATCSQVASYVSNIIGAATSAGSTENPMLKAQMLAVALDVYFSNPALGGNKTGAPVALGGVKINLTGVSAAFGGATSLTVLQMLTYQNTVSNVGGTVWYGQAKATQDLAQTTFNNIANDIAPIAP